MIDESSDDLFAGKYRISTARCRGWNYAGSGSYFVTVCTQDRFPWFGHVEKGFVCLSTWGSIVLDCWNAIPIHDPHARLDAAVVMPNHFHGIVHLDNTRHVVPRETPMVETSGVGTSAVETPYRASLQKQQTTKRNENGHHLGTIINTFKGACTRFIRQQGCREFAWQARYHDHIIRNAGELARIRQYIFNNPRVWNDGMPHQSG